VPSPRPGSPRAAGRFEQDAQWSLDYDVELQVASFEVWQDGKMVFGLDDWLPSS
jgi:hypothetical protein